MEHWGQERSCREDSSSGPPSRGSDVIRNSLFPVWMRASLVAQMGKSLPTMQETQFFFFFLFLRRPSLIPGSGRWKWQPAPVFLPGKSHGLRSLEGYTPWSCKETDTTEGLIHRHTLWRECDEDTACDTGIPGKYRNSSQCFDLKF